MDMKQAERKNPLFQHRHLFTTHRNGYPSAAERRSIASIAPQGRGFFGPRHHRRREVAKALLSAAAGWLASA
jgi:hypothetical protein